jgi:hypothetical protein
MTNRLVKAGAILFGLWGVLHVIAGLSGIPSAGDIGKASPVGGAIALDFAIILAGYGVLAIWGAALLWRDEPSGSG